MQGNLAIIASYNQDFSRARTLMESCHTYYQAQGDALREAQCLTNLGTITLQAGDYPYAKARLIEALTLSTTIDEKNLVPSLPHNLGIIAFRQDDYGAAFPLLSEAVEKSLCLGLKTNLAERLLYITLILERLGAAPEALLPLIGQVENLLAAGNRPLAQREKLLYDELSNNQQQRCEAEIYNSRCAEGARWLLEEALDSSEAVFHQLKQELNRE